MSKNIEIIETKTLLTLTDKYENAIKVVLEASKPQEMEEALNTLVGIKECVRLAKSKLKEVEAEPLKHIKKLESMFKELDAEAKNKVLELYKEDIVQKINYETGEVKNKLVNNLGSKKFVFTPEKKTYVVDKDELLKQNLFTKQITTTVVDENLLQERISKFGTEGLPMKEVITPAKVGVQYAQILTDLRKIGDKNVK